MTISIIIAVKTWQKNLEECVNKCRQLDYPDFEIIVLSDNPLDMKDSWLKVVPTGPLSPGEKRDIAIEHAKGEILAFIDDDAYPHKDWLKNAVINFNDPDVAAVGGPAVTPANDSLRQKVSGLIYASFLVSGPYSYRYLPKKRRAVDDFPSCNFIIRKTVMQELGGFNTNFWPGEDTKLCLDITHKFNKRIIYDPKVLVYHHRREVFLPHLKQIISYALHRGYFVQKQQRNSLKISYFLPSLFFVFILIAGVLSLFSGPLRAVYLFILGFYLFIIFIFSLNQDLKTIPLVFIGIPLSHLAYGVYFLKGLFIRKLKEEN